MRLTRYLAISLLQLPGLALAGEWSQSWSGIWNLGRAAVIDESTNPDNEVYELPEDLWTLELRPEFKAQLGKRVRLVARPRLQADQDGSRGFVNEAYMGVSLGSKVQSTIGLQNFQWGPAELLSPSNRLFHENSLEKSYTYETRGKALVRVNYSPLQRLSLIAMAEPTANGEERPAWDEDFKAKAVLKMEVADATQTNYIGLVFTGIKHQAPEIGSYASYEIIPAFYAYADLNLSRASSHLYPDPAMPGFAEAADERHQLTLIAGLRYTTERGNDMRLEYFKDDTAWDEDQRSAARTVLVLAPEPRHVRLYLQPGSALPGREFLYASLRIPDWGPRKRLTLSTRWLTSLTDKTLRQLTSLDATLGDHFVLNWGLASAAGSRDGELTQAYRWNAFFSGTWTL